MVRAGDSEIVRGKHERDRLYKERKIDNFHHVGIIMCSIGFWGTFISS